MYVSCALEPNRCGHHEHYSVGGGEKYQFERGNIFSNSKRHKRTKRKTKNAPKLKTGEGNVNKSRAFVNKYATCNRTYPVSYNQTLLNIGALNRYGPVMITSRAHPTIARTKSVHQKFESYAYMIGPTAATSPQKAHLKHRFAVQFGVTLRERVNDRVASNRF